MVGPGTTISGRYRLDERIAGGGMGDVWRGTDQVLGRTVAIKILLPSLLAEPGFAERFRGEARTMATINHPGVVDIYDYGRDDTAGAYLIMEYIEGDALSRTLGRVGRLTPARTMALVAQAADALQAAHDKGIVHRDVKPGNLLVRPDGTLVLTDFGIARSAMVGQLTQAGAVLGTASYISPEQAAGRGATPRSDVYALGVVAYQCLAGRRPFEGDNPVEIALKHVRERPAPLPPDIPPAVRAVVDRAMAKDPAVRHPTAAALAAAARGLPAARPDDAGPPPTVPLSPASNLPGVIGAARIPSAAHVSPAPSVPRPPTAPATRRLPAGRPATTATRPTYPHSPAGPPPQAAAPPTRPGPPAAGGSGPSRGGHGRALLISLTTGLIVLLATAGVIGYLLLRDDASPQAGSPGTPTPTATPRTTVPTTPDDGQDSDTDSAGQGGGAGGGEQATPSSQPTAVDLPCDRWKGEPRGEVYVKLTRRHYLVRLVKQASDQAPGTVIDISPCHGVHPGDTITVSYSTGRQDSQPSPAPSASGRGCDSGPTDGDGSTTGDCATTSPDPVDDRTGMTG